MRKINILGKMIALPPRYDHLSEAEIVEMPVEVIECADGKMVRRICCGLYSATIFYGNVVWGGAMYGVVDGKDALRFEDHEAYRRLSQ